MGKLIHGELEIRVKNALWEAGFSGPESAERGPIMEAAYRLVREARAEAFEEAAKEAESWFEMFDFESFDARDFRRFANPNQIAECIRAKAKGGEG